MPFFGGIFVQYFSGEIFFRRDERERCFFIRALFCEIKKHEFQKYFATELISIQLYFQHYFVLESCCFLRTFSYN